MKLLQLYAIKTVNMKKVLEDYESDDKPSVTSVILQGQISLYVAAPDMATAVVLAKDAVHANQDIRAIQASGFVAVGDN